MIRLQTIPSLKGHAYRRPEIMESTCDRQEAYIRDVSDQRYVCLEAVCAPQDRDATVEKLHEMAKKTCAKWVQHYRNISAALHQN